MAVIDSLTVHQRRIELRRPFVTAVRTAHHIDAVFVEVRDSDGVTGWGEAPTSWRVTGESSQSVRAAIELAMSEAIVGFPATEPAEASARLARSVVRNSAARMAVDCALFDLAARHAGVPLHRYLGGTSGRVQTDMTLSASTSAAGDDELVASARGHLADGFTTIKVKVGAGGNDAALLRRLRTELGPEVVLRVDANQGWHADEAIATISDWEDAGVAVQFVEQPVAMNDIDALERVTRRVNTPILADESVWNIRDLKEILRRGAADLVNLKLAKTGGLAEAMEMARLAGDNGVATMVGCMMESQVGIAAAASLASAIASLYPDLGLGAQDLDAGLWLSSTPSVGGAAYESNTVVLSEQPGLGIRGIVP